NGGSLVPTTSILCVVDSDDNILYEYEDGCPRGNTTPQTVAREGYGRQVVDPRIAFVISDILSDNAARTPAMGANSPLNTGSLRTSVKTGTTDNFKDNWTVGFTRNVAVGVWVGNSNGDPMTGNTSGLTGAAPIWNTVINGIYSNNGMLARFAVDGSLFADQLNPPSGMSLRSICSIDALREPATDCSTNTVNEWFLDSSAGIPDAQGNLQFPAQTPPTPNTPPTTGPWLQEIQPSIFSVLVNPIDPNIANAIVFSVQPGQPQPPAPLYCQVPIEVAGSASSARQQLFIAPPPVPADAVQAENWARANGYAFLPTIACTIDLLNSSGPTVITAFISQPSPGQVVSAGFPVAGTVQFSSQQAQYWKLELHGGQFGDNWVTMNDVQYNNVINGQLTTLPGLAPGSYDIQLVVVGNDGNYVQTPYRVNFTVQ
ncbi:MAG: hypothetical protein IT319_19260, partial [Anaerolineae bacterium]|nr:hypothetical protein [Anaerolineae bacterium]